MSVVSRPGPCFFGGSGNTQMAQAVEEVHFCPGEDYPRSFLPEHEATAILSRSNQLSVLFTSGLEQADGPPRGQPFVQRPTLLRSWPIQNVSLGFWGVEHPLLSPRGTTLFLVGRD